MNKYISKLLGTLAVLAVIGSVLISSVSVLAITGNDAWSGATVDQGAIGYGADAHGANSYAIASIVASDIPNADEDGTLARAVTTADASAISPDTDSYASAVVFLHGDTTGKGTISGDANAFAANYGDANVEINGNLSPRDPAAAAADVNITGTASAIGHDSNAEVIIGEYYVHPKNSEYAGPSNANYNTGAYIENNSSGVININATATANGNDANAEVYLPEVSIRDGSQGTINVTATATATGDDSVAQIGWLNLTPGLEPATPYLPWDIYMDDGSTGAINATMTATAEDGGWAIADAGIGVSNLQGWITVYTVAEAHGTDSHAGSVALFDAVPDSGFYFAIDADIQALAFAVMLSDGNNAFAIVYSNANAGNLAVAYIENESAFAQVGYDQLDT